MEVAEGARWPLGQVPWTRFDPAQVNAALCTAVRQMAFSEQATFSATRRFMDAFGEDTDFSQWLSVWFYEESRHPLVLLRWLALAGEELPPDFVRRGRVSTPFMKSRIGTLVTNVLSELIAAEAYLALARTAPEPLLRALTLRIAADESRHAASFFVFALRAQQASETPALERLDALKVLHFWFDERGSVSHPVNETMERLRSSGETAGWAPATASSKRMLRIAELLTGLRFDTPADVFRHLRVETRQLHRSSAPGP
jgi:hypothetical protein